MITPEQWEGMTIGKTYDIDKAYGAQCWDYFAYFVKYFNLPVSTYCGLTGYVCDLWRLKDKNGYGEYFDFINPDEELQNGDWCFWDKGSSHAASHVAMYFDGMELGQNQGAAAVNLKHTTWDIMGALRFKPWAPNIPAGASDQELNGHKYSVYRQSEEESVAVLSAGINKLAPIRKLDADVYVMAKVTGANFFQMRADQPDPYGTTYGDISAPLNDVWLELPNQNTTLYFDYETGVFGDCTGVHVDAAHNVASPAVVYPKTGNYQYARMIERNGDKGGGYVNETSQHSFVVRFTDGRYLLGIAAAEDMTPKQIAADWRIVKNFESIQFLDGGGSAQFGRWNGKRFEYVRDTGREVPSAVAIVSKRPYKPESEPIEPETEKDEEQAMEETKPAEQPENVVIYDPEKIDGWTDPEPQTSIIKERIAALLSVKSILTLVLTGVLAYLVVKQYEIPEFFQEIFKIVVLFFFGYQTGKAMNGGSK